MTVGIGSSGDEVTQIQLLLKALDFDVPITGVFDTVTRQAVMEWQTRLGIGPSGQWDPATHAETLYRIAQPGGSGGPLIVPPRPMAGMDLDQWQIQRDIDRFTSTGNMPPSDTIDGYAFLSATLDHFGLGSLKQWAKDLLTKGTSEDEILLLLQDQPAFKARFPAMDELSRKGMALTPEEYIQYERQVTEIMRSAGFPPGFYDGPEDFTDLLTSGKSPVEIQEQINEGYRQVAEGHPSVRQAFREYFGIEGDVALAMVFIDPAKSASALERMSHEAAVSASARRMDFGVSRGLVEELVRVGVDEGRSIDLFGQLDKVRGLLDETVGDRQALNVEGVVRSETGLSGGTGNDLNRRLQGRVARGSGAGGGLDLETGLTVGRSNE